MPRNHANIFKTKAFWATATTIALVGGVCIGSVAGYRELSAAAGAHRETLSGGHIDIRFNWPIHAATPVAPDGSRRTWMPLKVQQDLTALAAEHLTADPTDHDALARVSAAMTATGWFERLHTVRRADGHAIEIIGDWRTPVAVVRVSGPVGEIDRLISGHAELLPIDYPAGTTAMRFISGVSQPAPAACGVEWEGTDVQAGLKLLGYLEGSAPYSQIAGIDVSRYASETRLTIVTDTGAKVVWGAAPDDWAPSEPSAQQKLAWLTHLRSGPEYGRRIDAGRPLVDITSPRGIMIDQAALDAAAQEEGQHHGMEAAGTPATPSNRPLANPDRRRADRR